MLLHLCSHRFQCPNHASSSTVSMEISVQDASARVCYHHDVHTQCILQELWGAVRKALPYKENSEPPERLFPAGSWHHIRTQWQQMVRESHVEREVELQISSSHQCELTNYPRRCKVRSESVRKNRGGVTFPLLG